MPPADAIIPAKIPTFASIIRSVQTAEVIKE
jgi:hypothetical protein